MTERKRVVALGFFDGVHLGHGALMKRAVLRAEEIGAVPTVVSFDTHPDTLVRGVEVPLIGGTAEREDILSRLYGIRDVILVHFDRAMMETPWKDFADRLRTEMDAVHIVVGDDFRFGYRGEGTAERLAAYCRENGMGIDVISRVEIDGVTISSTYIRGLLTDGEMERANAFLGHPYTLIDTVRSGFRLGRTIGAPTINMRFAPGVLQPRRGVYATKAYFDGAEYAAVTNVGVRPTVGGTDAVTVESFLLGFSGELYGKQVRLEFFGFLRAERKFDSVELLKKQIEADVKAVRAYFEKN